MGLKNEVAEHNDTVMSTLIYHTHTNAESLHVVRPVGRNIIPLVTRSTQKQQGIKPRAHTPTGMAPSTKGSPGYCKEGFEETVGTNHLGHFLLANLLIKVRKLCPKRRSLCPGVFDLPFCVSRRKRTASVFSESSTEQSTRQIHHVSSLGPKIQIFPR